MNWRWKKGEKGPSDRAAGLSEALAVRRGARSRKEGSPRLAAFRLRRRALGPLCSSSQALRTRQRRRPPRQLILPALLPSKQARPELCGRKDPQNLPTPLPALSSGVRASPHECCCSGRERDAGGRGRKSTRLGVDVDPWHTGVGPLPVPAAGAARVWRGKVWRPCWRFHAEVAGGIVATLLPLSSGGSESQ